LTIFNHISAKHIFVRLLSGSKHLTHNTWTHWITWLSCTGGSIVVAYIIGSAIPIFGSLISLIGALFCPAVAIIPEILMWFHDNWEWNGRRPGALSPRKAVMSAINVLFLLIGVFFTIGGTYAAVVDIINTTIDSGPWTCTNNSGRIH
jgi:TRAP-type C4-dicarboxylate transport system permease small subunit